MISRGRLVHGFKQNRQRASKTSLLSTSRFNCTALAVIVVGDISAVDVE